MRQIVTYTLTLLYGIAIGMGIGLRISNVELQSQVVKTDTIVDVRYHNTVDTVVKYAPMPYVCKTVDTVLSDNGCVHIIEQKEYRDSLCNLWVSGCNPNLDSIKVFEKTSYIERTQVVKEKQIILDTKGKVFVGMGMQKYDDGCIPNVNIYYSKRDFLIGATAGLINSKPIYGVNVNYKIK